MQTPPQFSAIKIAGERAYDLAREGETVDIPAREIEIGRLDIVEHAADRTLFEVECGKGTYGARWPATWAATLAASVISPNYAGLR